MRNSLFLFFRRYIPRPAPTTTIENPPESAAAGPHQPPAAASDCRVPHPVPKDGVGDGRMSNGSRHRTALGCRQSPTPRFAYGVGHPATLMGWGIRTYQTRTADRCPSRSEGRGGGRTNVEWLTVSHGFRRPRVKRQRTPGPGPKPPQSPTSHIPINRKSQPIWPGQATWRQSGNRQFPPIAGQPRQPMPNMEGSPSNLRT